MRQDQPEQAPRRSSKQGEAQRNIAVADNQIDSTALFVGTREIIISHGDHHYRLRLTAQNKLILTK